MIWNGKAMSKRFDRFKEAGLLGCLNNLKEENMEWISVEKELPPQDGTAFIGYDPRYENNGSIYVISFQKDDSTYREAGGERWELWKPTHWMPLPQRPKD